MINTTHESRIIETLQTFRAGVAIPFTQSIVTGLFFAGGTAGLVGMTDSQMAMGATSLVVGMAAAAIHWMSAVRRWDGVVQYASMSPFQTTEQQRVEPISQQNFPPAEPKTLRVELVDQNRISFIDLPASQTQLKNMAAGLLNNTALAVSAWTGSNGLFTRPEFENLRDELIRRGLARWNGSSRNQGAALTAAGRAVMRKLAEV
jgi:hypothetical protein